MDMAGVPVRVLIADDQQTMVARTAAALEARDGFETVRVVASAEAAAEVAAAERTHVALVSAELTAGAEQAVRAILEAAPATRVVAHFDASDHEVVMEMVRAGASGYVVRDAGPEKLQAAVRGAARGEPLLDEILRAEDHSAKRARIRAVIDDDRLDIAFQPIVELDSRKVVGYEALARFSAHPQ